MGIFDFLRFSNCNRYPDSYAMDRDALYGLVRPTLEQQLKLPKTFIIATHFPDEFFAIQDRLAEWSLPYQMITRPLDQQWFTDLRTADGGGQGQLFLSLAEFLGETHFSGTESAEYPLALMMFDRHPEIEKEDAVLAFAESYPRRCELGYFLSLEDAVLKNVVNEALLNLLRTFGANDHELISSNMISKRLDKLLRRVAASRTEDLQPAESASQWYEINGLPPP